MRLLEAMNSAFSSHPESLQYQWILSADTRCILVSRIHTSFTNSPFTFASPTFITTELSRTQVFFVSLCCC